MPKGQNGKTMQDLQGTGFAWSSVKECQKMKKNIENLFFQICHTFCTPRRAAKFVSKSVAGTLLGWSGWRLKAKGWGLGAWFNKADVAWVVCLHFQHLWRKIRFGCVSQVQFEQKFEILWNVLKLKSGSQLSQWHKSTSSALTHDSVHPCRVLAVTQTISNNGSFPMSHVLLPLLRKDWRLQKVTCTVRCTNMYQSTSKTTTGAETTSMQSLKQRRYQLSLYIDYVIVCEFNWVHPHHHHLVAFSTSIPTASPALPVASVLLPRPSSCGRLLPIIIVIVVVIVITITIITITIIIIIIIISIMTSISIIPDATASQIIMRPTWWQITSNYPNPSSSTVNHGAIPPKTHLPDHRFATILLSSRFQKHLKNLRPPQKWFQWFVVE